MRTIDEVRQRGLDNIAGIVTRPGMYAAAGREMEFACRDALGDLAFIDERDTEHEAARERLHFYGKRGVVGAFDAVFGTASNHVAEVASVFAEIFHSFDYLEIGPKRDQSEWEEMCSGLVGAHAMTDTRRSAVLERYGKPTLVVDTRVLCYVSDALPARWIFFDCWEPRGEVYQEGKGGILSQPHADPLLRDIRVPSTRFDSSLVLTLWGKLQRWGPTWRFDHPEADDENGYPPDVREALRAIQASDPSQSLGPRRP